MADPIKYSDLIQPDESISQAISQMEALLKTYTDLSKSLRDEASKTKQTLDALNTSTDEGKEAAKRTASEVDRLAKAMKELQEAQSRQSDAITELKMKKAEIEKLRKIELQMIEAEEGSLKALELQYKLNRITLDTMSEAERKSSAAAKALIAETSALHLRMKELNAETDKHTRTLSLEQKATNAQIAAEEKLTSMRSGLLDRTIATNREVSNALHLKKQELAISESVAGSYNQMAAQYSRNAALLREMPNVLADNNTSAKTLLETNAKLYAEMKKIEEAQGRHTLSVGNYGKAWNGLSNSVNQLVREFPNVAVSANTFFLAISNNIPILFDEIKALRDKNEVLRQMGKTTEAVGPKILKAFFSWNTAMMAGVAVLTLYGGEIVNWAKKVFIGVDATKAAKESQDKLNESFVKGRQDAVKDQVRLKLLYEITRDVTRSTDDRRKAAKRLQDEFPKTFKNLSDEVIMLGKADKAYGILVARLKEYYRVKAAEELIVESEKELLKLEEDLKKQNEAVEKSAGALKAFQEKTSIDSENIYRKGLMDALAHQSTLFAMFKLGGTAALATSAAFSKKAADQLDVDQKAIEDRIEKLKEIVKNGILTEDPTSKDPKGKKESESDRLARLELEISKKLAEAQTSLIESEFTKRRKALEDSLTHEIASIRLKYKDTESLVQKGEATILALRERYAQEMREVTIEEFIAENEAYMEMQELKLEAVRQGTAEELELRLDLIEASRETELLRNSLLTEELRQSELDINNKYDAEVFRLRDKTRAEMAMREMEIQQELRASEFDYLRASNAEKTELTLQMEIERLQLLLDLNEKAAEKMSDTEVETLRNLIAQYKAEIAQAKAEEPIDFYEMMGLDLTDGQKSRMDKAKDFILGQIGDILQGYVDLAEARVEAAEAEVSAAEDKVESAEDAVQREIDARNAGYAADIDGAQAKLEAERAILDQEKMNLKEAEDAKKKALKAQQAMDSALQMSSMVTASAELWKSFAGIPIVGPALAVAAIATMFGSFAGAKIKAAQASKVEYGEGGMEMLEGGSHASGNDIPIGRTRDGRRRTAEGGEALVIINKRSTARYRTVLPNIVKSLNKGTFEDNFGSTYPDSQTLLFSGGGVDLGSIPSDVREIKRNGRNHVYTEANGTRVIVNGNKTTRILQ